MIIKAKYPKVGNKYVGFQGFGSLNGGNQISNVTKIDRLDNLTTANESIFPKDTIKEITRSLKNRSTYYENELNTIKILNEGNPIGGSPISEIISIERTDTLVAVHESVFPLNPAEVIVMRLEDRSTYYENEVATLKILNDLVDL